MSAKIQRVRYTIDYIQASEVVNQGCSELYINVRWN